MNSFYFYFICKFANVLIFELLLAFAWEITFLDVSVLRFILFDWKATKVSFFYFLSLLIWDCQSDQFFSINVQSSIADLEYLKVNENISKNLKLKNLSDWIMTKLVRVLLKIDFNDHFEMFWNIFYLHCF